MIYDPPDDICIEPISDPTKSLSWYRLFSPLKENITIVIDSYDRMTDCKLHIKVVPGDNSSQSVVVIGTIR